MDDNEINIEDCVDFKDSAYAGKNKKLCVYCSYRKAVPSKNNQFCSEICRLLHISISNQLEIKDIAKLIKLPKVDLIHIILSLKCQDITFEGLHDILNMPFNYKQKVLKKDNTGGFIHFD